MLALTIHIPLFPLYSAVDASSEDETGEDDELIAARKSMLQLVAQVNKKAPKYDNTKAPPKQAQLVRRWSFDEKVKQGDNIFF